MRNAVPENWCGVFIVAPLKMKTVKAACPCVCSKQKKNGGETGNGTQSKAGRYSEYCENL